MELTTREMTSAERSSVLVVGIGALGCQAAATLAATGIGGLTLVDDDRVERSNLQRQILFDDADIGRAKAVAAALALRALAPASTIVARAERLSALNAAKLVASHDVVVDATDDPSSKYLLNRVATDAVKPFVYGGVARTSGLALAVRPGVSACLACAFPPELSHAGDSCAELGILAPVAGAIGALQARLAVRLLEEPAAVAGILYAYEVHGRRWRTLRLRRDPRCSICSNAARHAA